MTDDTRRTAAERLTELQFQLLGRYVEWRGPLAHDDDCPEDDTCSCSVRPIHDAVNAICRSGADLVATQAAEIARLRTALEAMQRERDEARALCERYVVDLCNERASRVAATRGC